MEQVGTFISIKQKQKKSVLTNNGNSEGLEIEDTKYKQVAVHYFNLVLGRSEQSDRYVTFICFIYGMLNLSIFRYWKNEMAINIMHKFSYLHARNFNNHIGSKVYVYTNIPYFLKVFLCSHNFLL